MTTKIDIPSEIEVIPLNQVVDIFRATEMQLNDMQTHPRECSFVGIQAKLLADLELVLVRTTRKQADIEDTDLESDSRKETQDTRALRKRLKALLDKAQKSDLSAEEFYEAITSERDTDKARTLFISLNSSTAVVRDDQEILAQPEIVQERKKTLHAAKRFTLDLLVCVSDSKSSEAELLLVRSEKPCPVFSAADYGRRSILLKHPDETTLEILSLCQAFRITFAAELSIDMVVSSRGYSYTGSIIKFCDLAGIYRAVELAVGSKARSLLAEANVRSEDLAI